MNITYNRRQILKLAGAGMGAVALASCAPSGTGSNPTSSKAGTAVAGASPQPFAFASWSLNESASKPVIQGLMDSYAAKKKIKVTGVSYPYTGYLDQMILQIRGGQFSGAAQVDIAWLSAFASLGKLRDLGPVAQGRDYTPSALASGQYQGKQFGLPWTTGAIGLIANKELLGRAGITKAPTTIKEFESALTDLKGLGGGVIPYAAMTKVAQLKDMLVWMQTFGCSLLEGDKVTIGDDASVEAMTWYKSLYDKGLIAPDVDRTDARALFGQGKAAIYDDAIVGKGAVLKSSSYPDLASKLEPLARPVLNEGDRPRAQLWGHVVVVVDGEAADTATDFAQWLTSDEATTLGYFKALSLPPTTQKALKSPTVTQDAFTTAFGERITTTATPDPFWRFPQYAQMESVIAEKVQGVLVGKASPADAMKAAGKSVQALIG